MYFKSNYFCRYFKSNYFISAFQSCLSIQANSHLVNSPHFCQQSYQPTNPIFKFVNPVSNPPILDNFPHSKNPRLSFRLRTRPQTTESLYLLILLHPYLSTLDINTTVSTCPLRGNMPFFMQKLKTRPYPTHPLFTGVVVKAKSIQNCKSF